MKVLIVDDEPLVRRSLHRALKLRGHDVIEAIDGVEGLEKWRSEQPDAVFLDVLMPKMNGPQVMEEMGASGSSARVIMMSAYAGNDQNFSETVKFCDQFVAKPFKDIFEVVSLIEK